jgi:hypothetical protein
MMSKKSLLVLGLVILVLSGLACKGRRRGGMFDPATVTTLTGTVKSVDTMDRNGMSFVSMLLDTGSDTIRVGLGPETYVSAQTVKLAEGDAVTAVVSKVDMRGKTFFIAATVTKGAEVLSLRDPATGKPNWPMREGGQSGGSH